MMLGGQEGLQCEVCVEGMRLESLSKFKYLGCNFDEVVIYEAECSRKGARGRRDAGAIRSLVNVRSLQHKCARVFNESLLGFCYVW